jgi:hypothetical protein
LRLSEYRHYGTRKMPEDMKKCPYCGAEYPDDATVCTVDGQSLASPADGRKNVAGVWRGAYGYNDGKAYAGKVVPFTLILKKGWVGHFTGTVTEDAPDGTPGTGSIDGYFGHPTMEFTKQMPVGYMARPDGVRITLREYFIEHGHACENELPGPPISYEGTFLDANRVQGSWVIKPGRVSLPDGWGCTIRETRGNWCAEFITSDTNATPAGGPKEPFYDKSLLPKPEAATETESGGGSGFPSLGKFNVADAEELLNRFEQANLRFEINRDDSPMRQMSPITAFTGGYAGTAQMIEIFVHPDDEAKAVEIIGEDSQV